MENYTKIRVHINAETKLYVSEEELVVFKLSGDYMVEYLNDKYELHRTDGPAIEYACGCSASYVRGILHFTSKKKCKKKNGIMALLGRLGG